MSYFKYAAWQKPAFSVSKRGDGEQCPLNGEWGAGAKQEESEKQANGTPETHAPVNQYPSLYISDVTKLWMTFQARKGQLMCTVPLIDW